MNTEKITIDVAIDNWANSDVGLVVIDYPDPQPIANSYIIAPGETVSLPVVKRINQFWASSANGGVQDDKPSVTADGRGYANAPAGIGTKNKWINNTEAWTAEIIWTDIDITGGIASKVVLTPIRSEGGLLYVEVVAGTPHGNVVIGVKKTGNSDFLWSWHLWITGFDPEAGSSTLPSGAVVMDRVMGAWNNTGGDGAAGLFYQWGRKDPFVGLLNPTVNVIKTVYAGDGSTINSGLVSAAQNQGTLDLSIKNPILFYTGTGDWIASGPLTGAGGYNRWGGHAGMTSATYDGGQEKSIYDPCPFGWRVLRHIDATTSAWDGVDAASWNYDTDKKGSWLAGESLVLFWSGNLDGSVISYFETYGVLWGAVGNDRNPWRTFFGNNLFQDRTYGETRRFGKSVLACKDL